MVTPTNPLISIITVVYNSQKYLEGTIKSILRQSDNNFEYIVVDGGSTDGTVMLLKKYDKDIDKWISEPDDGLYHAMNKALKMASGIYVWFVNSGDKIYCDKTIELLSKIAKDNSFPDVIYGETVIIDEHDKEIGLRRLKPPLNLTWESLINGLVVCHQSFIVKKDNAPLYELKYKISADYDWVMKCLKSAETICNTKLYLSRYLDNGLSKNNIRRALRERFNIMVKNFGFFKTLAVHVVITFRFLYFVIKHKRF